MDKYEYKIRSEEIKALIAKGEYADAAALADTIDWSRVKSVMMLCTVSDLYKINRRYEDARELLLLAYDRHPGGRSIVYSLCELCIKMDDFVPAVEYYKEFVQVAPKDSGRYVLQYKLFEAQDVSLEERIEVLEELKANEYSEKWAYELAYLYHCSGLTTQCVKECDELFLWFGEGKYVLKAMELKQLHEPLTPEQQEKYEEMKGLRSAVSAPVQEEETAAETGDELDAAPTREIPQDELDIQVKLMNVGQYDTINIQKELAQNMKELLESTAVQEEPAAGDTPGLQPETSLTGEAVETDTEGAEDEEAQKTPETEVSPESGEMPEAEASQEPGEMSESKASSEAAEPEEQKVEEVFFGETGELDTTGAQILEAMKRETLEEKPEQEETPENPVLTAGDMRELHPEKKPDGFAKLLGMEYDGQISMVVPESEQVEKQITGQISLEDVLVEWERMKKDSEEKRKEAVRQHVMQQTGAMFTEFEAAARDGLLEKLEKGALETAEPEISDAEPAQTETEELTEAGTEPAETDPMEDLGEVEELEEIEETDEASDAEEAAGGDEAAEEADEPTEEDQEAEEAGEFHEETDEAPDAEEAADGDETAEESAEPAEEAAEMESGEGKPGAVRQRSRRKRVRPMSAEERQSFGSFAQNRSTRDQIVYAIDNISMAAYTGNIIVTGEEGMDTLTLAKKLIREVQLSDSNFSGKIAKISGESLNRKGVTPVFDKLVNGALIVQKAGGLADETVEEMIRALDQENSGMIVVLEDTRKNMHKLLRSHHTLTECFNIEINVEAMDNDSLVAYAKTYAGEQEYSIDELGILALHTRIAERQTSDHTVTPAEVKEMVDQAIYHANRKTLGHFIDILIAKRYDEEDMIILREKDFM